MCTGDAPARECGEPDLEIRYPRELKQKKSMALGPRRFVGHALTLCAFTLCMVSRAFREDLVRGLLCVGLEHLEAIETEVAPCQLDAAGVQHHQKDDCSACTKLVLHRLVQMFSQHLQQIVQG